MKFQLAYNMERNNSTIPTEDVMRHSLEIIQMAERGGFHIVWAAEHHGLEMNIAPNPFLTLTWWASHTDVIRLGTAVAVAAYWNPINLAGEAAFFGCDQQWPPGIWARFGGIPTGIRPNAPRP